MKFTPITVFILEDGKYSEITYEELCLLQKTSQKYAKKKFLPLHSTLMEVTKEQYDAFYRVENRRKYVLRSSKIKGVFSYDALTRAGVNGEDILADDSPDAQTQVEEKELLDELHNAIETLTAMEKKLLNDRFVKSLSQVEIAKLYGVNQANVSRKLSRIIKKLKTFLEKFE